MLLLRYRVLHTVSNSIPKQPTATLGQLRRSFHWASVARMPTRHVTPQELLERNQGYSDELWVNDKDRLQSNAKGQNPSILWIGCSDSRVPESVVARCKPGDIFVHRNIANQFNETDDSANSVLTYGVEALGVEHSTYTLYW